MRKLHRYSCSRTCRTLDCDSRRKCCLPAGGRPQRRPCLLSSPGPGSMRASTPATASATTATPPPSARSQSTTPQWPTARARRTSGYARRFHRRRADRLQLADRRLGHRHRGGHSVHGLQRQRERRDYRYVAFPAILNIIFDQKLEYLGRSAAVSATPGTQAYLWYRRSRLWLRQKFGKLLRPVARQRLAVHGRS